MAALQALSTTVRNRLALTLMNAGARLASPGVLRRLSLSGVDDSRGWVQLFTGSLRHLNFQTEVEVSKDRVRAQATVFSCMTQIASDIGKLRAKLVEQTLPSRIWRETTSPQLSPLLRKPNRYQTWQKFIEQWVFSLLSSGNTYVLKVRDARGVVVELYVLDPSRCRPLVARGSGWVYYELQQDDLSRVPEPFTGENALPASEIIHDRINCIFHPLVGLSPIFACGLTATKGLRIEENATRFFANQSQPGGVLTAPSEISDETAKRLKEYFEEKFTGENAGKVAVLGDGLSYTPMTTNAVDAQLIEQLQWSAKQICATFHVPGYMVGAEAVPPNNNVEALTTGYYTQCLQTFIEGIENALDDGLLLLTAKDGKRYGIELDLDGLVRMDSKAQVEVLTKASGGAYLTPDEARAMVNREPVEGGNTLYKQHQDYSLAALARRDAMANPFDPSSSGGGVKGFVDRGMKSMDDLRALVAEEVRKAMAALPDQTDVIAARAAMLVQPGRDGLPGRTGTPGEPGRDGKDGIDGRDGRDGFVLDNFEARMIGDRVIELELATEDRTIRRHLELKGLPIYRGTLKSGQTGMKAGDAYTYGGSVYIVRKDTDSFPPSDDWQLAVKSGAR